MEVLNDIDGNAFGVFIPITEWNSLKEKYNIVETENDFKIPEWHKKIAIDALNNTKPQEYIDWEIAKLKFGL
jgi:hypothetical protein